jgi:hypothetical protein
MPSTGLSVGDHMTEYAPLLMILLGVASLIFRGSLVEWRRRMLGLSFTEGYRHKLELLQVAVGVILLVFGVAMLAF